MTAMKCDLDTVCDLAMPLILRGPVKYLASFIEPILRKHYQDWWQRCVLPTLKPVEHQRVRDKSISDLDLAVLLRVLDFNWAIFKKVKNLTAEDRNYAKEMQTVRTRWAHDPVKRYPRDIIYRDLDTLERFAGLIQSPDDFIEKVKVIKKFVFPARIEVDEDQEAARPERKTPGGKTPEPSIQEDKELEDKNRVLLKEAIKNMAKLSSKEMRRYTNFYKGRRVKFQLHPNPHGVDLVIPEADENLPSCNFLKQVDIKSLHGYKGDKGANSNTDWLEGNGKRFTNRPAVAFHLPEGMKDDPKHAGWKELDRLLEYAENR